MDKMPLPKNYDIIPLKHLAQYKQFNKFFVLLLLIVDVLIITIAYK